jgi:hypothetical protein
MRSVEHVERMEDMKKHATIIIVKPQENTTIEGTKQDWNLLLHLQSTLQNNWIQNTLASYPG